MTVVLLLFSTYFLSYGSQVDARASSDLGSCLINRAAVDIGSGSTKFVVATVNHCDKKIKTILVERKIPLKFKEALTDTTIGNDQFIISAKSSIDQLIKEAQSLQAKEIYGVATEVFRKNAQARDFLKSLRPQFHQLEVLDQQKEALLGLIAARAQNSQTEWAWDIGGGSMQITDGRSFYLSNLASVSFKNLLIQQLELKQPNSQSPNPIGIERLPLAFKVVRLHQSPIPQTVRKRLENAQHIAGIGGVHNGSVAKILGHPQSSTVTYTELKKKLLPWLGRDDLTIGGEYPETDVSNVILVLEMMKLMGIKKYERTDVQLTHALIADPRKVY